ncbi:MAG: ABC transporter ATP-binding protein [Ignavibacteriales bacterium]|nr:ABC transporter ATP-binding protein [Ignavibacteriales bacterium]
MHMPLERILEVEHLGVNVSGSVAPTRILREISFSIQKAEILCILGASGSGKTTLTRALTMLLKNSRLTIEGRVNYGGVDIVGASPSDLLQIRRRKIRYIFQDPAESLNPLLILKTQFRLADPTETGSLENVLALLHDVGIENPGRLLSLYPHQASVGMLQRFLLAMALCASPDLIIADEPTSALDPEMRDLFIHIISRERSARMMGAVIVTHDVPLAESLADTVAVMYRGEFLEYGPKQDVFSNPLHPYTSAMIRGTLLMSVNESQAVQTHGDESSGEHTGCRYRPLCPKARDECAVRSISIERISEGHHVRCLFWK